MGHSCPGPPSVIPEPALTCPSPDDRMTAFAKPHPTRTIHLRPPGSCSWEDKQLLPHVHPRDRGFWGRDNDSPVLLAPKRGSATPQGTQALSHGGEDAGPRPPAVWRLGRGQPFLPPRWLEGHLLTGQPWALPAGLTCLRGAHLLLPDGASGPLSALAARTALTVSHSGVGPG